MTNQEAVNILLNERKCIDRNDGTQCDRKCESCDLVMDAEQIRETYSMAISAIKARDAHDINADTISRQAAIDFINAGHLVNSNEPRWSDNEVVNFLKSRPSAQPYTEAEIQKMQDLEQAELDKAFELGKEEGRKEAQPESQWIPCSERLPETSGTYLVSGMWESGRVAVGDCEYSNYDGYFNTAWNFDVIAWCELPEPYRGEGENR